MAITTTTTINTEASASPTASPNAPTSADAAAATTVGTTSTPASATNSNVANGKPKRPRRSTTAERRATHNAVERARRETLNARFIRLAGMLPPLSALRRPSKSAIVNSSIATVQAARRHRVLAAQTLKALAREAEALRREVNEWRARARVPTLEAPVRSAAHEAVLSGEVEEIDVDLTGDDDEEDEGEQERVDEQEADEGGDEQEQHAEREERFAFDIPQTHSLRTQRQHAQGPPSPASPSSASSVSAPRTPPTPSYLEHQHQHQRMAMMKIQQQQMKTGMGMYAHGYARGIEAGAGAGVGPVPAPALALAPHGAMFAPGKQQRFAPHAGAGAAYDLGLGLDLFDVGRVTAMPGVGTSMQMSPIEAMGIQTLPMATIPMSVDTDPSAMGMGLDMDMGWAAMNPAHPTFLAPQHQQTYAAGVVPGQYLHHDHF